MVSWNGKVKRLLKSELIRRGITNSDLVLLLNDIGIHETKASIDSKISRGSFSASFLIQCLTVIGCPRIEMEEFILSTSIVAEKNTNNLNNLRNDK